MMPPSENPDVTPKSEPQAPLDDALRPHTYDGIQEYDKRLPNWWLITFYGAIAFSIVYWFYYHQTGIPVTDGQKVAAEISKAEAARLASAASLDDATLWRMSLNPVIVDSGKQTFLQNCATCHLASLRGKDENPTAIGANLADTKWLHGGLPMEIYKTVSDGVLAKGMPNWGGTLGPKGVSEAVAYILSHHKEGEPIEIDPAAGK